MADLTAAARGGRAEIEARSTALDVLLATRNRDAEQANPTEVRQFKQEAGQALRVWAQITDEKLNDIHQLLSRGHGLIGSGEAQALWELLDRLKMDVYRYVEDRDSLLEDYEPLQRASAPETLVPFWEYFDVAYNKVESHKAALAKYQETYREQSMTEIRKFEEISRDDSREIRNKMREFIGLARPLMQIIGKL